MQEFNVPMPSVFVGDLLENGRLDGAADNADASAFIVSRAVADLGGRPISEPSR